MGPPPGGNLTYVKDLSKLGRELDQTIILDNSAMSYIFQPDNGIPITTWMENPHDRELLDLIPPLQVIAAADNVYEGIRRIGGIAALPINKNYNHFYNPYAYQAQLQAQQQQQQQQYNDNNNQANQHQQDNIDRNSSNDGQMDEPVNFSAKTQDLNENYEDDEEQEVDAIIQSY